MAPDERNDDIISEQSFSKEQSKSQAQNSRKYKALDAIEDRELENREPMQTAVGIEDLDSAVSPQADSPGDSEEDATAEYMMGVNFRPESEDAFEVEEDEDLEDFEKDDKTVYAEQKSNSSSETPSLELTGTEKEVDESVAVIASGRPSPRADANRSTSTN